MQARSVSGLHRLWTGSATGVPVSQPTRIKTSDQFELEPSWETRPGRPLTPVEARAQRDSSRVRETVAEVEVTNQMLVVVVRGERRRYSSRVKPVASLAFPGALRWAVLLLSLTIEGGPRAQE